MSLKEGMKGKAQKHKAVPIVSLEQLGLCWLESSGLSITAVETNKFQISSSTGYNDSVPPTPGDPNQVESNDLSVPSPMVTPRRPVNQVPVRAGQVRLGCLFLSSTYDHLF